MAVNTTDGSVVTDLAVSWAIVTANEVDQRNEAWALASCSDCITRAVAFQVLLIISGADAVAPVNIAAAANYECDTCTTEALAVQLVVTLTGMPSEQAQAEIAAVMAQVEALEQDLDSLTSGQIYFLLQASQAQILAILERDGTLPDLGLDAPAEGTTDAPELASASDAAGAEGSTATTSTSPDGSDTSAGSEPTATEPTADSGSDSTAEPTAEPTSEATTEPTTEPTATETTEATASGTESTTTSEPSPTDEPTTSTSP